MLLSSYLQTVLCSLPKYLEYILVLQVGLYLQNKEPLKLKLYLNQKTLTISWKYLPLISMYANLKMSLAYTKRRSKGKGGVKRKERNFSDARLSLFSHPSSQCLTDQERKEPSPDPWSLEATYSFLFSQPASHWIS